MKYFWLLILSVVLLGADMDQSKSVHQFTVNLINGSSYDMAQLKGKKVMIVNTASKCGLTPQFEKLQWIYTKYKDQGFVVLGFPTNDFLNQDPGPNDEIAQFCKKNYGVTFPMMEKISVKGTEMHPLYQFLTKEVHNGHSDNKVKWNFQKYLINGDGELEEVIDPSTSPDDPKIIDWIMKK